MGSTTFITLPSASTMLVGVGYYSDPFFQAFLPYAEFAIGVIVGAILVLFIYLFFTEALWRLINHTNVGASMSHLPGVPALDRWSFRHSRAGRRFMADIN